MTDVKVSALTELTATAATDAFLIVDASESSIEKSKYVTQKTLRTDFAPNGETIRSKFTYKDTDEIYVSAGRYDCDGKVAAWNSQLTSQLSGASASTWHYLYLDYSAITSLTVITATELIWSSTAPSYSHTKRGWYNGSDRCIFAVLTNASSQIREFFHCGEYVCFADAINTWTSALLSSTWTDWDIKLPAFSNAGNITFEPYPPSGSYLYFYWRTNGQSGTSGHILTRSGDGYPAPGDKIVVTDTSGKIEIKVSAGSKYGIGYTNGWYFPTGI